MTFKFINEIDIDEWEVETDSGWQDISSIKKTIPYIVYKITTESGKFLEAADKHILFDEDFNEIFLENCVPTKTKIITKDGPELVTSVVKLELEENMYDITVDSDNHRYYSNDILSHNTTTAVGYMLWFAMFHEHRNILIAAHKGDHTKEIIAQLQMAYENIPDHIRCGVTGYARTYIEFDNGTRIQSETTTEKTGRGRTIHLLYIDEFAFVRNNIATEFWVSISATLTQSKGKCIITSTPNSDEDQFARIWKDANKNIDEFGNETEIGTNGFKPVQVNWREHPDRSEEWAKVTRVELGNSRFRREHECCIGTTIVTLLDTKSNKKFDIEIGELYKKLS